MLDKQTHLQVPQVQQILVAVEVVELEMGLLKQTYQVALEDQALLLSLTQDHNVVQAAQSLMLQETQSTPLHHLALTRRKHAKHN